MSFNLAEAFVEIKGNTAGLVSSLAEAKRHVAHSVREMGSQVAEGFAELSGVGMLAGLGIAGVIAEGVREFSLMEKSLRKVEFALGDTEAISGELEERIVGLGIASGQGSGKVAEAVERAARAGYDAESAFSVAEASVKLAVGSFQDLGSVTGGVLAVMQAYAIDGADAVKVTDNLVVASRMARGTVSQMADALSSLAPKAATLGIGLEDLESVMGIYTQKGFGFEKSTRMAGVVLNSLIDIEREAIQEGRKLPVDISQEAIAREGLAGVLKQMAGLKEDELRKLSKAGDRYIALKSAIQDVAGIQDNYNKITSSGGATQAAYQKSLETSVVKLQTMMEMAKETMATMGGYLVDGWNKISKDIVDSLSPLWNSLVGGFKAIFADLESEWGGSLKWLNDLWTQFLDGIGSIDLVVQYAAIWIAKLGGDLWDDTVKGWDATLTLWKSLWMDMWTYATKLGNDIMAFVDTFGMEFTRTWKSVQFALGFISEEEAVKAWNKDDDKIREINKKNADKKKQLDKENEASKAKLFTDWNARDNARPQTFSDEGYKAVMDDLKERAAERLKKISRNREGEGSTWFDDVMNKIKAGREKEAGGAGRGDKVKLSSIFSPQTITGIGRLAPSGLGVVDLGSEVRKNVVATENNGRKLDKICEAVKAQRLFG